MRVCIYIELSSIPVMIDDDDIFSTCKRAQTVRGVPRKTHCYFFFLTEVPQLQILSVNIRMCGDNDLDNVYVVYVRGTIY